MWPFISPHPPRSTVCLIPFLPCTVLVCQKELNFHVLFRSPSAHCATRLVYSRTPLPYPSASPVPFHRSLHKQHQPAEGDCIPRDTAHSTTCLQTVSLGTQHTALHSCRWQHCCCSNIHPDISLPYLNSSHKERLPCCLRFAIFWDTNSAINIQTNVCLTWKMVRHLKKFPPFYVAYFAVSSQSLKYTGSTVDKRIWSVSDDAASSTETLRRCKIP